MADGLGKIGVLVALESNGQDGRARAISARQIAMHVAAANPLAVDAKGIDPAVVERERGVLADQAKAPASPTT